MSKPCLAISLLWLLSACHTPARGSEEYWFNKFKDEQRAQCTQLPSPLSEQCLKDVDNKSYQQWLQQRQANSK